MIIAMSVTSFESEFTGASRSCVSFIPLKQVLQDSLHFCSKSWKLQSNLSVQWFHFPILMGYTYSQVSVYGDFPQKNAREICYFCTFVLVNWDLDTLHFYFYFFSPLLYYYWAEGAELTSFIDQEEKHCSCSNKASSTAALISTFQPLIRAGKSHTSALAADLDQRGSSFFLHWSPVY